MGMGLGAHGQQAWPLNPVSLQSNLGAQRGQGQVLAVLHYRHGWWHEHLGCEGEAAPTTSPPLFLAALGPGMGIIS